MVSEVSSEVSSDVPEINNLQIQKIIDLYRSRSHMEDLQYITSLHGDQYIMRALNTNKDNGVSSLSVPDRREIFGSNER